MMTMITTFGHIWNDNFHPISVHIKINDTIQFHDQNAHDGCTMDALSNDNQTLIHYHPAIYPYNQHSNLQKNIDACTCFEKYLGI